ncbi:T9SS type A sorting domain-containing protein [Flammeovirgaceae bacterium SG7u.111]|nr:T9SS type A sorting domain-containing protein [Flammeovirgaceae bacterium SG7u.132]WPO37348.1 T9SS type A sorting domain-containing protein [Flammeovirgaceae bacterium SG7u.111]
MNKFLLVLLIFFGTDVLGQQFAFEHHDSVKVLRDGKELSLVGGGGTNSAQFNTIDLNADGVEDLVVFDRTNDKVSTFLAVNNQYKYAPDYEILFPQDLTFWMLLRDFDGDGKKDIFTSSTSGISVYKNMAAGTASPKWELFKETLSTFGFSGRLINLKVDVTDIPAISDIDGDGDLDVLNFKPLFGGTVEFHQNMSMERYGSVDSLEFDKITDRWGDFEECGTCNTYIFNQSAACRTKAETHAGSAILALDLNGDGDKEMLLGEITCENLVLLMNEGTVAEAKFNAVISSWPASNPIDMFVFPAAFHEDLDFDGKKDLVVSPNLFTNEADMVNFYTSNWYYKNTGTVENPEFTFVQNDFLQSEMLDFGEYAVPAFVDYDQDGDYDMFVGNRGKVVGGEFFATISHFENTGDNDLPIFELVNDDFAQLSDQELVSIKPSFADLNGDGRADLYFSARPYTARESAIYYLLATGSSPLVFDGNLQQFSISIEPSDEPLFFDVDEDGDMDLLLGKEKGASLHYYENLGDDVFEQKSIALGGIGFDSKNRELSIEIADILRDGKPELITGDFTGRLTIYPDFQEQLALAADTLIPSDEMVYNSITKQYTSPYFGQRFFPAALGSNLVLGSVNGGLHFLKSTQVVSGIEDGQIELAVVLYPNPAADEVYISSSQPFNVKVFNILGEQIANLGMVSPIKDFKIDTKKWEDGLYIIRLVGKEGYMSKKVIIKH